MDQVAAAIADPVRRQILMLLTDAPMAAGDIAGRFTISRPAVSRHLRVLRESGLVDDTLRGRSRVYEATPEPLAEVADWIARLAPGRDWGPHLDALDTEVRRTTRDRRRATATTPDEESA